MNFTPEELQTNYEKLIGIIGANVTGKHKDKL